MVGNPVGHCVCGHRHANAWFCRCGCSIFEQDDGTDNTMSGKPCQTGCECAKHSRTPAHNARIGISVSLTAQAKRKHCTDCGRIIADGETLCPECKMWYMK